MAGYAENSRQAGELSTTEAARELGAHVQTVRRWISEGRLEARVDAFGRSWVQHHDLLALHAIMLRGQLGRER